MKRFTPARLPGRLHLTGGAVALLAVCFALAAGGQDGIRQVGRFYTRQGPVEGDVPIELRIFSAETGGAMLYWETGTLHVVEGHYETTLGDRSPPELSFPMALWWARNNAWLEWQVNGQVLLPRQRILAVPFALNVRGLEVDATGNVGLGTSTPQARLHIAEDRTNAPQRGYLALQTVAPALGAWDNTAVQWVTPQTRWEMRLEEMYTLMSPYSALRLYQVPSDRMGMTWTTNAWVGVGHGATTPLAALDVRGDMTISGDYMLTNTTIHTAFYSAHEFRVGKTNSFFAGTVTNNPTFVLPRRGSRHSLGGAGYYWSGGCGVDLPVGSRIVEMRVYYLHNAAGQSFNISAELFNRSSQSSLDVGSVAAVAGSVTGTSASIRYFSTTDMDESYDFVRPPLPESQLPERFFLQVTFGAPGVPADPNTQGFYGVMLKYTCDRIRR